MDTVVVARRRRRVRGVQLDETTGVRGRGEIDRCRTGVSQRRMGEQCQWQRWEGFAFESDEAFR